MRPAKREKNRAVLPVLVAIGCFAVLLGTLAVLGNRPNTTGPVVEAAPAVENASVAEQPRIAATPVAPVLPVAPAAPSASNLPVETAVVDPPADRLERVQGHLSAGEFGPALEVAGTAADVQEQSKLLRLIAAAQLQAGEFNAVMASIRRIPIVEQRIEARAESTREQALAGGASMADFSSLMQLIQENTSGTWEEIDGTGGTMTPFETGVRVHPNGMLRQLTRAEQDGRLEALGVRARAAELNDDMARPSALRLVSLTRLEKEIARQMADGRPIGETMRHLAGLSQVQYVIIEPESREILIGGPAEAWRYAENGLAVGVDSGSPTLQLDDLVTVLRTFSHDGEQIFGCSINPRQDGLRQLKEYVEASQSRGPLSPAAVRPWVQQLQRKLGLQDVQIYGVPADSRVARVIVEADYRMKLIGIDRLEGVAGMPSFFDLLPLNLQKNPPGMDALRWWLTMKYDGVSHSPDHNVFEIQGSAVLCQSENQLVTAEGQRVQTGKSEETNRLFAENFTRHYQELAARDQVFADLQNVFDLALVAALLQHERADERLGWDRGVFAANGGYQPAIYVAPREVESVVNHRVFNGRDIVVQVAGGVRADVMSVVKNQELVKESPRLSGLSRTAQAPQLPEGRWWWDAAGR